MAYAINLSDDKRILFVTSEDQAVDGSVIVDSKPEGNWTDYRYVDGEFVYDPLPEDPAPEQDYDARITALEEELAAAKIILGVE